MRHLRVCSVLTFVGLWWNGFVGVCEFSVLVCLSLPIAVGVFVGWFVVFFWLCGWFVGLGLLELLGLQCLGFD